MLCLYRKDDNTPRFTTLFCMLGRGSGKNAFISFMAFCLSTETNGIKNYDISILANSEEQAKTSFNDIYNVLTDTSITSKMKKNFYWNKECITNLKTGSSIKYRTSSAKSADGRREGCLIYDEVHQYENWDLINVARTGLGKVENARELFITTNGDVRDAVLDEMLKQSIEILNGEREDNEMLPFICRLDDKDQVNDESNWYMANPSLYYRKSLLKQMRKEYISYQENPYVNGAFLTKRMNLPQGNKDVEVTSWENILATNEPVPDLTGYECTVGIDYTKTSDLMSACLLFRKDGKYYTIQHSWLCKASKDLKRIKAPLDEWEQKGLLTMVDDVEISPSVLYEWLEEKSYKYDFIRFGVDNFRFTLLSDMLKDLDVYP